MKPGPKAEARTTYITRVGRDERPEKDDMYCRAQSTHVFCSVQGLDKSYPAFLAFQPSIPVGLDFQNIVPPHLRFDQ